MKSYRIIHCPETSGEQEHYTIEEQRHFPIIGNVWCTIRHLDSLWERPCIFFSIEEAEKEIESRKYWKAQDITPKIVKYL